MVVADEELERTSVELHLFLASANEQRRDDDHQQNEDGDERPDEHRDEGSVLRLARVIRARIERWVWIGRAHC